ncbi:MAG: beta-lactamase family protein [Ruminiclostridium sp.]|nr:beta-lactamase family protein [Ruminiclostridium sp.]
MKRMISGITAALCAAAVFAAPVSAESEACILPSGISVDVLRTELEKTANDASGRNMTFASAAVGIFGGDEILYTGYFGNTDIKNGIPADENSVYEWGSISKTFVWVSAMQLWERGKLDLDADIRAYLPEGFFRHLTYDEPITFMNLMNHNAGWQETIYTIETEDESKVLPLKEALRACEPAQVHRPGEVTAYSNYGAALAGYIIECVSGTDYCEYVHENILEPLGMTHTSVNPTHSDNQWVREQRGRLKCYSYDIFSESMIDLGSCLSYIMPYPAGAVTGTLGDLMIYGQALVNDEAPLFRSPETQKLMFTATSYWGSSDIPNSCHGFWADEHGVRTYGHSGATDAGQENLIFDPVSKVGLAVMVNEPMGNVFLNGTPALVFGELSRPENAEKIDISGNYLMSRSTGRGLFRYLPYLTAVSLNEPAYDIGNSVYILGEQSGAVLLAGKIYPDGTGGLEYGSMELLRDDAYVAELGLLTLYFVLAVAALYFIRLRRKLKKHGRQTAYAGSAVIFAGNAALVLSGLTWLASYVVLSACGSGIPFAAGAAVGIVQIACAAVCSFSAVGGLVSFASGKTKARPYLYILHAAANITAAAAVVYFEMYMFWGC